MSKIKRNFGTSQNTLTKNTFETENGYESYLKSDRASSSSSKWMSATSGTIFSLDFLASDDLLEPNIAAGRGSEALRFMFELAKLVVFQCSLVSFQVRAEAEAQQNEFCCSARSH